MSEPARDGRPALRLVRSGEVAVPSSRAPNAMDDTEILAALRRGDPSAATAFHDRVRPQVDRTIVRLLGRRGQDHEDLAQNSMIAVVQSIARFRGDCSLDTWTARVTAHTVYKDLRRRKLERRIFEEEPDADTRACHRDPIAAAAARSALARVRKHLDAMDPVKAWTLVLHDVAGYDLREIADITDASVAAAQTRLVRGRRELHDRIQADPDLSDLLIGRKNGPTGRNAP